MKHQNLKGKDHRTQATKDRDRAAGEADRIADQHKRAHVNLDAGGESLAGGRASARPAAETRRTERD